MLVEASGGAVAMAAAHRLQSHQQQGEGGQMTRPLNGPQGGRFGSWQLSCLDRHCSGTCEGLLLRARTWQQVCSDNTKRGLDIMSRWNLACLTRHQLLFGPSSQCNLRLYLKLSSGWMSRPMQCF